MVAGLPDELAAACQAAIDELARRARKAGDDRPLGLLRSGVLADLVLRPWRVPDPVAAHLEVPVPPGALTLDRFLASGAPVPGAFTPPGAVAGPAGAVAGTPVTAAHGRDLLARLDAIGLQAPPNGSVGFACTDGTGAPQAVATLRELRQAARRGCPTPPAGACGCPLIGRPEPTDAYQSSAAQRRFLHTRDRTCRHPGCDNRTGWADADHVLPPAAGPPTAPPCAAGAAGTTGPRPSPPGWTDATTPDGIFTVRAPSGVTRTSRPPDPQLTGPRVRTRPPNSRPNSHRQTTPRPSDVCLQILVPHPRLQGRLQGHPRPSTESAEAHLRDRERWSSFFEAPIAAMSRDSSHRLRMSVTSLSSHLPVDHGLFEQVAPATSTLKEPSMTLAPTTTPPVGTR